MVDGPKILTLDIETTPMGAWVFDIWGQNISVPQFRERTRVMGFGYKWHHERVTHAPFEWDPALGHEGMIGVAWDVLDKADIVVHFNGKRFDIPHLYREFDQYKLGFPSPFKEVDLLHVARRRRKFVSNKLQNIAEELGIGQKMKHEGFELWTKCMDGDPAAQKHMVRYCKQDVLLEERLFVRWAPEVRGVHYNLYTLDPERDRCSNPICGSENIHYRGYALTDLSKYPRFQCQDCGKWGRSKRAVARVDARGVAL